MLMLCSCFVHVLPEVESGVGKKSNVESFAAVAKPLSILAKLSILDVGGVLATPVLYLCSEALVQRCSVKKVILEISQNVLLIL